MQMKTIALANALHMRLLTILDDKIFINEEIGLMWEVQVF